MKKLICAVSIFFGGVNVSLVAMQPSMVGPRERFFNTTIVTPVMSVQNIHMILTRVKDDILAIVSILRNGDQNEQCWQRNIVGVVAQLHHHCGNIIILLDKIICEDKDLKVKMAAGEVRVRIVRFAQLLAQLLYRAASLCSQTSGENDNAVLSGENNDTLHGRQDVLPDIVVNVLAQSGAYEKVTEI
jgi:hypothetical protein